MTADSGWKQRLAMECADWALAFEHSNNGALEHDGDRVKSVATLAVILAIDTMMRRMEGDPAAFPDPGEDEEAGLA